jgi:hypothetical protein
LGRIDEENGNYENALRKYALALSIFDDLKDPSGEMAKRSIGRLRDKMGEDAFRKAQDSSEVS